MRVFFDASVIIVALLSRTGGSALLLRFIKTGRIVGVTSQTVIEEVVDGDKPTKLNTPKEEIELFIAGCGLVVGEAITATETEPYRGLVDEEDDHLVAGANLTNCSHLVSLDKKHVVWEDVKQRFLPLRIVSPKEVLRELLDA